MNKRFPTWLKGGTIAAVIAVILFLVPIMPWLIQVPLIFVSFSGVTEIFATDCDFGCYLTPLGYIYLLTFWFGVGALVGWLVRNVRTKM